MKSIEQFFSEPKNKTETQNHTISAEFLELKFPLPQVNHIRLKKKTLNISQKFFKILKISQNSLKNFSSQTSYYHFSYQFFYFFN